jgi:transcriptional regulator with XRE-family HTH domain
MLMLACMDVRRQFGSRLRLLREQMKLSQEELAFEVEMNRTYLSDIERGTANPSLVMIVELAQALKVQPAELLRDITISTKGRPGPRKRSNAE